MITLEDKDMKLSTDRILTTHVGSLPRNATLTDLLLRREGGETYDPAILSHEMDHAVRDILRKQARAGIDVVNDGEQQRVGFQTYISQRMAGFGGESKRNRPLDYTEFPAFAELVAQRFPRRSRISNAPQAIGAVKYRDSSAIDAEIARVRASTEDRSVFADQFMTSPSPGIIATTMLNAYYDTHEAYVMALAREMRTEYRAIYEAGLVLQIDAPDLAMERIMFFQGKSEKEFLITTELHVAALNLALDGIPREAVRLHCCWGNWDGPHNNDVPLEKVLPVLYQANVGGLSIEFANPRHQHEYGAFAQAPLPAHFALLPGVIDSTSNFVEHPEVVARRIEEAVAAVGDRERVIASSDCGFSTFAGFEWVAEDVVWAKLRSAVNGALIASGRLWPKNVRKFSQGR
jgi:5-methyltetrahydropteroyltriglutamate--homocysteine methyltransferase